MGRGERKKERNWKESVIFQMSATSRLGAENSIQVLCTGGRDPVTWVVTSSFPECIPVGNLNWDQRQELNSGTLIRGADVFLSQIPTTDCRYGNYIVAMLQKDPSSFRDTYFYSLRMERAEFVLQTINVCGR